ncbi:MAG TPA: cobalamin-binding protein, partial [Actinomycetes bacterium]|nr:cobalamin-binding protein [Actinomycetes bacterium]
SLRGRLDAVRAAVAGGVPVPVMVLEWTDPPFTPGHWVPDMVTAAGGLPLLGSAGARSVRTSWPAVLAAQPAVVVAASCGFGLADSMRLAEEVADRVPRDVPLWAVDANASFARPGPRLVDGVEALAAILHPDARLPLDHSLARRVR